MSLDTLLKAAQYIEQQEQKKESQLSITPSSLGEFFQRSQQQQQQLQQQHFYDNVNNSRNNNNTCHHYQVSSSSSSSSSPTSSPPTAAYVLTNGQMIHNGSICNNNNSSSQLNHNDFDYGVEAVTSAVAATAVNGRSSEGRNMTEEPYSNGHSSPSSFIMIQSPLSSTTTSTATNNLLQQSQLQQGLQSQQLQQQKQQQQQSKSETLSSLFSNNNNNTTITIVDNNKNAIFSNGNNNSNNNSVASVGAAGVASAALSNGSVNLAALSAAAAAVSSQPIVINVTNNRTATNTFGANSNSHSINSSSSSSSSSIIRNSPPIGGIVSAASTAATVHRKNCIPLTPPPMSTRKFVESSRIRSFSLSSHKITANGGLMGTNGSAPALLRNHQIQQALAEAAAVAAAGSEDSSQSSLNLSSSTAGGIYLNGTGSIGSLNLSGSLNGGGGVLNGVNMINGSPPRGSSILMAGGGHLDHSISGVASSAPTSSGVHQLQGAMVGGTRRRTISSNSNGSSCTSRAGTREVHNKLEKHRRAQLKECFEQLKNQLPLKDEERKKTSNLAILGAALKQIKDLQRQQQELEQQSEQLAKEKINAQKKIVSLKRELGAKIDNIDFSSITTDIELGSIPIERVTEGLNDSISLSSGRGSMLYSSSSSLSSGSGGNTMSSPLGAGMQTAMPTALSPVISQSTSSSSSSTNSSNNSSPISPNMMVMKSSSLLTSSQSPSSGSSTSGPLTVTMPLSLTAKNISATSLTRGSPTPSTPSPSPSSSSGVSSSSSIHSSSPPMAGVGGGGGVKIVPNIPASSVKFGAANVSANGNTFVTSPVINITSHSENNGGISSSHSGYYATSTGMPLNMNSTVATSSSSPTSSPFFSSISIHSTASNAAAIASSSSSLSPSILAHGITTISHSKEFNCSGRNGLTRKVPSSDGYSNNIDGSIFGNGNSHHIQHQHKLLDEGEQPAKVFKVVNGISLGSVDKDNKLSLAGAPLQLSQVVGGGSLVVSPFLATPRLVGANSLATIELSSGPQSSSPTSLSRCSSGHSASMISSSSSSSPPSNGGAQLHKLLMSAVGASSCGGATNTNLNGNGSTSNYVPAAELGRLPGGAELNILPTATNGTTSLYRGNGKLAIVNNAGISLKGAGNDTDSSNGTVRGVHVMNGSPVVQSSGLASIAVSQVQQGGNFAQLIATAPQLTGKVNLSVGGQSLPLLSSQYLGSMKPMVVAVPNNNSNQPTLPSSSSVVVSSSTSTASTAIVTGTTNGNAL